MKIATLFILISSLSIGLGLGACGSSEKAATDSALSVGSPDTLVQRSWELITMNQLDHWGNSAYWKPGQTELCSYYVGLPGLGDERIQFTDQIIWRVPPDSISTFSVQERREQGGSRMLHRDFTRGDILQPLYPVSAPSSLELSLILRACAFRVGKSFEVRVIEPTRFGPDPESGQVEVIKAEPLSFQEDLYETWAVEVTYQNGQHDWLWYERSYPNRLIRRVTSSQETHILKSVRTLEVAE